MKKISLSKKLRAMLILTVAVMTLCSCGKSNGYSDQAMDEIEPTTGEAVTNDSISYSTKSEAYGITYDGKYYAEAPEAEEEVYAEEAEREAAVADTAEVGRKIIYSSSYDIETKKFDESVNALNVLCGKYGAYFESSNTYAYGGSARTARFRVRVPVKNYEAFIGEADTVGVVIRSSQDNKDITEQYFDTEARLESARIREERVLEILKNSSKLDDVLALERELADIRYEIESYTGTLRKYDSLVSYATVEISISEVEEYVEPKAVTVSFGERMGSSFRNGFDDFKGGIQNILVFLSYNCFTLVVWVVVLLILVLIIRLTVKKLFKAFGRWEKTDYGYMADGKVKDKADGGAEVSGTEEGSDGEKDKQVKP